VATYSVQITSSAEKDLKAIDDRATRNRIADKIRRLGDDPRPPGSIKMAGRTQTYRVRQGDYRVLYEIEDDRLVVLVIVVAHRGDAYR